MRSATAYGRIAAVLLLGVGGCNSSPNRSSPSDDGGLASDAADAGDAGNAGDAADAADDGDAGDATDAADATVDADNCLSYTLQTNDPVQPVTFQLNNPSSIDRYLVTSGYFCDPFTVDDLTLSGRPSPYCEGPDAGATTSLTLVPAGGSITVNWDGLIPMPYQVSWRCNAESFQPCLAYDVTVRRSTDAGAHQATFRVVDMTPSCSPGPSGCASTFGGQCDPLLDSGVSRQVSVTFDLPASAPIAVDVSAF